MLLLLQFINLFVKIIHTFIPVSFVLIPMSADPCHSKVINNNSCIDALEIITNKLIIIHTKLINSCHIS